jgi:hypothetical protein
MLCYVIRPRPPIKKAQDFFFKLKKTTFIDQQVLIYVVFLLTVVNCVICVNKLRNCVRK